jgi:phosphatidate cytidylyltransferase
MAPVLSPNKTIEGAIGGLAAGVVSVLLYGLVMELAFGLDFQYGYGVIYGLLGSVVSIIGDLSFSMVKRETGIKDYGTIFRAHGGVLDRFDSVIFAAPVIELLILLLPILQ